MVRTYVDTFFLEFWGIFTGIFLLVCLDRRLSSFSQLATFFVSTEKVCRAAPHTISTILQRRKVCKGFCLEMYSYSATGNSSRVSTLEICNARDTQVLQLWAACLRAQGFRVWFPCMLQAAPHLISTEMEFFSLVENSWRIRRCMHSRGRKYKVKMLC